MQQQPPVLWLASWYPTKLDPYPGDFIQRHAKALALYYPVHVLHIAKDETGAITSTSKTEHFKNGNLEETIHYYHPFATGIKFLDRVISTRAFLKAGKKLIRKEVNNRPGLFIHLHVAMRHGLLAVWAKRKFGIPFVITEHWTGYNTAEYPAALRPAKWFWMATRNIFKEGSYFYPEVKKVGELVNQTIYPIPYKPVSNCVDTALFYYEPGKPSPTEQFHFIHVSTLSFQKNIVGILNVIERLNLDPAAFCFTLVGPADPALIQRVGASNNLRKLVRFTGPLTYPEVATEMRKAHCLLMFSRFENQPCVIVEALCSGLPVISTKVGGILEVLDPSNGILLNEGQEKELEQSILQMPGLYQQFDVKAISAKAQALYSYEKIGAQILAYYQEDLPKFFL